MGLSCGDFLLGREGKLTRESYLRLGLASPFISTSKAVIALRRKSQLLSWARWTSPPPSSFLPPSTPSLCVVCCHLNFIYKELLVPLINPFINKIICFSNV